MKNFVTSDLRTDEKMNHAGGQGPMYIKHLLGKEELNDKCGLYAEVTIPAGSALGYHEHVGNSETYYVLKGHALYNDNGSIREIGPGEVTFTPNGFKHGVDNTKGTEDFVFMALLLMTDQVRRNSLQLTNRYELKAVSFYTTIYPGAPRNATPSTPTLII